MVAIIRKKQELLLKLFSEKVVNYFLKNRLMWCLVI